MSAVHMALGLDELNASSQEMGNPILSATQLHYFKQYLGEKLVALADNEITDPFKLAFLRGEISALSLIINASVAASNAANQGE